MIAVYYTAGWGVAVLFALSSLLLALLRYLTK